MPHKEIPEDIKTNLKTLVDHFCAEDQEVRERQIRIWRKLKLYWNGFTRIWYSEVAHDWRVWDYSGDSKSSDDDYYDKPINVFKAYLESIIAALSITIPAIDCAPDDADNPLDVSTAKSGNKIAALIGKHNNASFLWLHALYVYCTEGMVACYSYPKEDKAYGTYETNRYEEDTKEVHVCPVCNEQLADELFTQAEADEFMPDEDDVLLHDLVLNKHIIICPQCAATLDPNLQKSKLIVQRLVGVTNNPKSRQCLEVYGGLYVKVPNYAKKQEDCPYLIFSYETHYANALEMYPELRDKIEKGASKTLSSSGLSEPYERWGRLSPQYYGEYPVNNVTIRNCWFRPAAYNILGNEEDVKELKAKFPDGCKVVFIDDCFAAAENEALDDCWTLTHNPLSDYIHHDPLGILLVSVQDIVNDLISLIVQTIEQGIPQTFIDPAILDFDAYRQMEATPGGVYPTKPVSATKNISEGFFSFKAAALGEEVLPALNQFQQLGQLASGALPSLFGGIAEAGSKTASEYAMSRAQALQRLQTPWKMLSLWWKDIFSKAITSYIKEMADDERLVEKDKQGNYVNVFIRKSEVAGKIGNIELESSEQLPASWAQLKDVIMKMVELNNPQVLQILFSPENIHLFAEATGLNDLKLPGEEDKIKQNEEIQQLLASQPIVQPPDPMQVQMATELGMQPPGETEIPSVEVDAELDNHQVEADICRKFLISDAGRLAKIQNRPGYYNVLLHFKAHMAIIQQQMMAQQQASVAAGEKNPKKSAQTGEENGAPNRLPIK